LNKHRSITNVNDKKKITALERVISAVFGRPETSFEYRTPYEGAIEIILECDVDDAIKIIDELEMNDIQTDFYVDERELPKDEQKLWNKKWEGFNEIHLFIEPQPWKEITKLEEENKELKKQLKDKE